MSERERATIAAAAAAFWSFLVLDFVTHAVVLASWWRATASFWLPPLDLAKRIPFAYSAFAIYCVGLCALLVGVHGERPRLLKGLWLGAIIGIAFGLTSALGVYSIVRTPTSFLVIGPTSTAICSTGAGVAAAGVLRGVGRWRRVGLVVAVGLVVLVAAVIVQNMR